MAVTSAACPGSGRRRAGAPRPAATPGRDLWRGHRAVQPDPEVDRSGWSRRVCGCEFETGEPGGPVGIEGALHADLIATRSLRWIHAGLREDPYGAETSARAHLHHADCWGARA